MQADRVSLPFIYLLCTWNSFMHMSNFIHTIHILHNKLHLPRMKFPLAVVLKSRSLHFFIGGNYSVSPCSACARF